MTITSAQTAITEEDWKYHASRPIIAELIKGPLPLERIEQLAIEDSMQRHEGDKFRVAEELGIAQKTLYNKLGKYEFGSHGVISSESRGRS